MDDSQEFVTRMFDRWLQCRRLQVEALVSAHEATDGDRPPTAEEIAEELGISPNCAAYYLNLIVSPKGQGDGSPAGSVPSSPSLASCPSFASPPDPSDSVYHE